MIDQLHKRCLLTLAATFLMMVSGVRGDEPRPAPEKIVKWVGEELPAALNRLGFTGFDPQRCRVNGKSLWLTVHDPPVGSEEMAYSPVWRTRKIEGKYAWERIKDREHRKRSASFQIRLLLHQESSPDRDSWEEFARRPNASGNSRSREVTLGKAPKLERTGWIEIPFDTTHSRQTYTGPSDGDKLIRTTRERMICIGSVKDSYGSRQLYKRATSDFQNRIEARAIYRGIDPPFEAKVLASNFDYSLTEAQVDAVLDEIMGIMLNVLDRQRPRTPAPVTAPEPVPDIAPVTVTELVPEPEPDREPEVPVDRSIPPDESTPTAATRIDAMDGLFRGVEDALQGALLQMAAATRGILEAEALIQSFLRSLRTDDLMPSTSRSVRERIQELMRQKEILTQQRDALEIDADETMSNLLESLEKEYEKGGWGDSDFHANVRVITAEERKELLLAQFLLARNDIDALENYATELQNKPTGSRSRKSGLGLEGMAHLRRGRLVDAIEAFRTLRRRGYLTEGTPYETMERLAEVELLRAMQQQTVATRLGFHENFNSLLDRQADTRPGPFRDRSSNWSELDWWKDRADWWLDGSLWMSWYRTTQGALGELLGSETEASSRAREVGTVADEMATKHVALGMVIGLRQKGHTLEIIREMSTRQFQEAFKEGWGKELTNVEANQRRAIIRRAFELEDLATLASGKRLDGDFDFSKNLEETIRLDPNWERSSAEWGAWFGDMATPGTVFMTFAPMAKFTLSARAMSRATASAEFKTVHTLAERFQSSAAFSSLVNKTSGTAAGRKFLQAMTTVGRYADRGKAQAASVFFGELIVQQGASHTIGQTLGDEAQLLFDALVSVGAGDVRTLAKTFSRVTNGSHLRAAAGQMKRLADRARIAAAEAQDIANRIRRASKPRELASLRDRIKTLPDLPPEISTKMLSAIDQIESGASREAILQTVDDVYDVAGSTSKRARAAKQVAEDLEELSYSIPDEPVPLSRSGDPGTTPPSGEVPTTLRPDDGLAGTTRPDGPNPGRPPVADPPPTADARFIPNQRNSLAREADRAMMREEFEKAADSYSALLAGSGERLGHSTRGTIELKRDLALRAARIRARAGKPTVKVGQEFTEELEAKVRNAIKEGRYEPVPKTRSSFSSPRAIFDEKGNPIAYFKAADIELSMGNFLPDRPTHPEGMAETLGSNLRRAGQRSGPTARVLENLPIDGKMTKQVVIAAFDSGTDLLSRLKGLRRHPRLGGHDWVTATLVAHKAEVAEDMVYAMVLGDGDRHFGNFWLKRDGGIMPFDFGLADIGKAHGAYRNERLRAAILEEPAENLQRLLKEAEGALGLNEEALRRIDNPNFEQRTFLKQIDQARDHLNQLTKVADGVPSIYRVPEYPEPPDFKTAPADFADYAQKLMEKHWQHGTRTWNDFAGDFLESVIRREDVLPHIQQLQRLRQSGEIERVVRKSLAGAAEEEIEFAVHMLEARVDHLETFFKKKFSSVPDVACLLIPLNRSLNPLDNLLENTRMAA